MRCGIEDYIVYTLKISPKQSLDWAANVADNSRESNTSRAQSMNIVLRKRISPSIKAPKCIK